ncbi:hypothetical protein J437_LFUL002834, partial [Ladona fulva]
SSEKLQQKRREQYRQVQAHVRKEEGRIQAYGWSLPVRGSGGGSGGSRGGAVGSMSNPTFPLTAVSASSPSATSTSSHHQIPVPVPVYCKPLTEEEPGMKVWCAAGVDLTGGRTSDGGSIVGASVFYLQSPTENCGEKQDEVEEETMAVKMEENEEERTKADGAESSPIAEDSKPPETKEDSDSQSQLEKLDRELREGERLRREGEELERQLSSLVWICTSTLNASKVTVVDANNPAIVLASFEVCSSHLLCIASVPGKDCKSTLGFKSKHPNINGICMGYYLIIGAKDDDYLPNEEEEILLKKSMEKSSPEPVVEENGKREEGVGAAANEDKKLGNITFVSCATGCESPVKVVKKETKAEEKEEKGDKTETPSEPTITVVDCSKENNEFAYAEVEKMSSVLPTMWLGSKTGAIYVHSSVAHWRRCIHSIKLKDSVLSIVHIRGRVLVALANGTVAVFRRHSFQKKENDDASSNENSEQQSAGQWDLSSYFLVDLGEPRKSIRCMTVVHSKVWCGYGNIIHVLNPRTLEIEASFHVHPRKDSQIRQMAWLGEGVWVSIRMDSTLRLYHAHTYEHLQDVDIEPYVSKMLGTGKVGFSFARITALLISSSRLWIGTGNGVIISVPLMENAGGRAASSHFGKVPGSVVRVYGDSRGHKITPGSFIPYCSIAHVQISFHGHHDAVKFFVAVPGGRRQSTPTPGQSPVIDCNRSEPTSPVSPQKSTVRSMLVMSGGEGYIDFRNGNGDEMEGMGRTSHSGQCNKVHGESDAVMGEESIDGAEGECEDRLNDDGDEPV